MRFIFFILILISCESFPQPRLLIVSGKGGTNSGAEPAPGAEVYNPNLIYIMGQSNAAGLGAAASLPGDLVGVMAGVNMFNPVNSTWQPFQSAVNSRGTILIGADGSADTNIGFYGVECRLMKSIRTLKGVDQYCLKWAMGGSRLAAHGTNRDWAPASVNECYTLSSTNYQRARQGLGDKRPPRCIIWIQGEQDASDGLQASYQANLEAFITAQRTFYGYSIPFVIVGLSDGQTSISATPRNAIAAIQVTVGAQTNNYFVSSDGLTTSDGIHYDAASLDTLATRIYNVYITIP